MAGATRFHLVRHATTDAVGRLLAGRAPGHGLNAQGVAEAAELAHRFCGRPPAGVLSSPRLRAQQTASAIAGQAGVPVLTEAGLDEIDFGDWTGQSFAALQPKPDWHAWNSLRSLAASPGGETMLQAQSRAIQVLQRLHAQSPGGSFVLVSHADVIKAVLAYVLGSPIDLMQRIEISPASCTTMTLCNAEMRVLVVNTTSKEGLLF